MQAIFAGSELELMAYPGYREAVEDATGYEGNALLKARALRSQLRGAELAAAALADDSGLEVEALGGRPGLYSARYAGASATWQERRRRLLDELRDVAEPARGARFVCAMALILPDGEALTAIGSIAGAILPEQRGDAGFGYDPLFFHPPSDCTFAQLPAREKNVVSHRRAAADALLGRLRERV